MLSPAVARWLADLILVVHVGIVLFVVLGQLAILLGGWRGWGWIRHFGLRVTIADSSLNGRRLSGYFKATSAQEVADILSALLATPVTLSGNQLTIRKPIQ